MMLKTLKYSENFNMYSTNKKLYSKFSRMIFNGHLFMLYLKVVYILVSSAYYISIWDLRFNIVDSSANFIAKTGIFDIMYIYMFFFSQIIFTCLLCNIVSSFTYNFPFNIQYTKNTTKVLSRSSLSNSYDIIFEKIYWGNKKDNIIIKF